MVLVTWDLDQWASESEGGDVLCTLNVIQACNRRRWKSEARLTDDALGFPKLRDPLRNPAPNSPESETMVQGRENVDHSIYDGFEIGLIKDKWYLIDIHV